MDFRVTTPLVPSALPDDATCPPAFTEVRLAATSVLSLCWDGDELVDWVGGGARWTLQGNFTDARIRPAFSFDMAATLPGRDYAVVYKRLGTKALLLENGRGVREIDRSYYFAESYEYPIALFRLPTGRAAIAHCPQAYNRLRIDDLETGLVLASATSAAADFFHSRLCVSPDGRWLASAGWRWHPVDDVALYDIEAALANGTALDRCDRDTGAMTESGNAAAFDPRGRLLVTSDTGGDDTDRPTGSFLARLDPDAPATPDRLPIELDAPFMPVGSDWILLLADIPRLLSVATGKVVATWPGIALRVPTSAIQSADVAFTPVARDLANARIAIAHDGGITIIAFDVPRGNLSPGR